RYTSYIAVGHVRDFSDLLNATGARGFFFPNGKKRQRHKILNTGINPNILVLFNNNIYEPKIIS
ncbi:hypothetical protein ACVGV8_00795, partial [Enterobacter intestinihominis]